ncbi:hypothetical protein [Geomonas limicola]|uniref:hypothetical protein n=1 Tax=Geomonas limicola TaxID=2740186 RepID=UPI00161CBC03|nr:hypothetical protein [Geomonas limicola]
MAWLLVPAVLVANNELGAHLMQLVMLWIAVFSTISIARAFEIKEPWSTLSGVILVAMPTVLAMAGTAMPDVPAMAFGVAGIERFISWNQTRKFSQATLSATLVGIGILLRPHLIVLVVIGAVLINGPSFSLSPFRNRLKALTPLILAPVISFVIALITKDPAPDSGSISSSALKYSFNSVSNIGSNVIALPIHWVLAMAFGLPWLALRWQRILWDRLSLLLALLGTFTTAIVLAAMQKFSITLSIVSGIGVAVLCDVLSDAWKRRDSTQLGLGLWLLIALPTVPYCHLPAKYLVVSAPAAALLLVREMVQVELKKAWFILCTTVVVGIGLGIAILRADETFTRIGRRAAIELVAPNVASGQHVWYIGH